MNLKNENKLKSPAIGQGFTPICSTSSTAQRSFYFLTTAFAGLVLPEIQRDHTLVECTHSLCLI